MTSPPNDVYEAAARAYDEAGSWTDPIFALRAAADSAYAAGVAVGRAQAAADIRAHIGTDAVPRIDTSRGTYFRGDSIALWAARIAEGGEPRG